ncbi:MULTISPECIES: kinase-associated lipoprotein B [Priestia]|uniref:kinase-associated lipoprotein B n=1 Tax=Priestia TaxID=2800373 RepID=UPI0005EC3B56|nr:MULTISPECIES: kinase-associated lipoprotein B [Priestia]KJL05334.1 kinase [Priestia aryabhattai B8W22]MBX4160324.1 kinase-associated lipoprotein B [Priestia megaterium]MED3896626.1 kinase-associated lipoprotein B [Priestia aryabhattai]
MTFTIGQTVKALYKTGKYIGEITQVRDLHYVVRIQAVLKHPEQGDLHNPGQVDVPFFHERKALAFREQANIPQKMVHLYEDSVPDYKLSLKKALELKIAEQQAKDSAFAQASIACLEELKKEYGIH